MQRSLTRFLIGDLPAWMRRDHPVTRYELGVNQRRPLAARLLRALGVIVAGMVLVVIGILIATGLLTSSPGQTPVQIVNAILYFPTLALQLVVSAIAVTSTAGVIAEEQRRQNWDTLRATEGGAGLRLRARWSAAVFYRLRGLLGVVIAVRVLLIGLMLYELTAFQGHYIDLLIIGITPEIGVAVAVVLTACVMTAAILLPLTGASIDASAGLIIAASVPGRTVSALAQALYIIGRVGITVALLLGVTQYLDGQLLNATDTGAWLLVGGASAIGDWGLFMLYLDRISALWATIPYGIFLGIGLLIYALLSAATADRLLALAARIGQRRG